MESISPESNPSIPRFPDHRPRVRSMLLLIAFVAMVMGTAPVWGWPGDLLLSTTQFPVGWAACGAIGYVLGREGFGQKRTQGMRSRVALAVCLLATIGLVWMRHRADYLWYTDSGVTYLDEFVVRLDVWLRSRESIPVFWKRNCTHSPAKIVLGIGVTGMIALDGLLMASATMGRRPRCHNQSLGGQPSEIPSNRRRKLRNEPNSA